MKTLPQRVILSGYYGFDNFGDDLILSVLIRYLTLAGFTPIVLSNTPEETAVAFSVESLSRTDFGDLLQAIRQCHGFISGGGGLFQDVTGWKSPLYYGSLLCLASLCAKKTAFFAQGVGPLHTWFGRMMTRMALQHAKLIVVRDQQSKTLVHQLSGRHADLMADSVWLWEADAELLSQPKRGLGISLRPWKTLTPEIITHLAKQLLTLPLVQQEGVNLIDAQPGLDMIPLAQLERYLLQRGITVCWYRGLNTVKGIASSTQMMGMRFHTVLVAALLQVPSISLSYDPKVVELAKHLKLADFPLAMLGQLDTSLEQMLAHATTPDTVTLSQLREKARQGMATLIDFL
jgi:polysaccharide pyruvyl transferase CsaB